MKPDPDPKLQNLVQEYHLGDLLSVSSVGEGNVAGYELRTSTGSFFAKSESGADPAALRLYRAVEQTLNNKGVRQARLLVTPAGNPISRNGFIVYEWLSGSTTRELTDAQFESHIAYLARHNKALAAVPLDESTMTTEALTACDNPWRKAASLAYLFGPFNEGLDRMPLSSETREAVEETLIALALRSRFATLPKQLIHSDVGPGNILFEEGEVVAIIDFTPAYESHLYALCVSLFWYCVFPNPGDLPIQRISKGLSLYDQAHGLTEVERESFYWLLVKAVGFRLFSRLIVNQEGGKFTAQSIERMALCARSVLDTRVDLEKGPG